MRLLFTWTLVVLVLPSLAAQVDQARDDFNFAAGLYDRGLYDRAVEAFATYLERWGEDDRVPRAHFYLGQSLVECGRQPDALGHFLATIQSGERGLRAEARLRAAELLHQAGRHREAQEHLEGVLKEGGAPALAPAVLYFLGEATAASGDSEGAARAYLQVLQDHEKSGYAPFAASALGFLQFKEGSYEAALPHFELAARSAKKPDLAAEARTMVGECLLRLERYPEARRAFAASLQNDPGSFATPALAGLALAALDDGDVPFALQKFEELKNQAPTDPRTSQALLRAAVALHEGGQSASGLRLLQGVRPEMLEDPAALPYWSGILLVHTGEEQAGLDRLRQAIAQSGSPRRRFGLGEALAAAGRHQEAAVVFAALRSEEKDSGLAAEATFAEAFSRNRLGEHARAVSLLEPLLAGEPPADLARDALFALGENLFALSEYGRAQDAYTRLLETREPERRDACLYKRAWCRLESGQAEEALSDLALLVKDHAKSPLSGEARFLMARCHEATGRTEEARRIYDSLARQADDPALAARSLLGGAAQARKAGKPDVAIRNYQEAAARAGEPSLRAQGLLGIADTLLEAGRPGEAEAAYARLCQELPDDSRVTQARLGRGWALRQLGRHQEAAALMQNLATQKPDPHVLGEALYLWGLEESALERFPRVLEALQGFDGRCPGHRRTAEVRLLLGIALARSARPREAEPHFAAVVADDQAGASRAAALYEWAFCREAGGDRPERDRLLARLAEEHPASPLAPDALFRLGEAAYEQEHWLVALDRYLQAANHDQAGDLLEKALYKAAWALRRLDRRREAAITFQRLATLTEGPVAAEAGYLAGEDFEAVGEHAEAEACFRSMAAAHPDHELAPDAALRAVLCLKALGDLAGVIREAPAALSRHGDHPRALWVRSCLGDAFFDGRAWGRARTAYREVTARSEGELGARAQFRLGLCHLEENDKARALDELLKVPILYHHAEWAAKGGLLAADLLAEQGSRDKARRLYQEVCDKYGDRPEAAVATERLAKLDKEDER